VYSCLRFEVGLADNSKGGIMLNGVLGLVTGLLGSVTQLLGGLLGI
jgi:hypothetical protein